MSPTMPQLPFVCALGYIGADTLSECGKIVFWRVMAHARGGYSMSGAGLMVFRLSQSCKELGKPEQVYVAIDLLMGT